MKVREVMESTFKKVMIHAFSKGKESIMEIEKKA